MKQTNRKRAAIYARFSTDLQREESIDAQVRAMRDYASRNDIEILGEYIDRAKSATTDQRPYFQQMIEDSKDDLFDMVLVHKLDRFSRDRYDSVYYKRQLKIHGVMLRSVLENIDDSPESVILEAMLEGFAEYYSKNLAREVEKGKRENALKAKHVGGAPPLGYNVDRTTMRLVINPHEAEAVRMIFAMYLNRKAYGEILDELRRQGYAAKAGTPFVRNSLHSILKNPKYTGLYTYSRSAPKSFDGKRNGHKYKDDSEIIKVENGVPMIIPKDQFEIVQEMMKDRRQHNKRTSRYQYLLSGKLTCGICSYNLVGNNKPARPQHPVYVNYICNNRDRKIPCHQYGIRREVVEPIILSQLVDFIFNNKQIPNLIDGHRKFMLALHADDLNAQAVLKNRLDKVKTEIGNIIQAVSRTGSDILVKRLNELDEAKKDLDYQLVSSINETKVKMLTEDDLRESFQTARTLLKLSQVSATKLLISRYIHRVIVYPDKLEIQFNLDVPNQVIDMSMNDGRHEQVSHNDPSLILPKKRGSPQKIVFQENHNKSAGSFSLSSESPNFVDFLTISGRKKKPQNGLVASSAVDSLVHHSLWCCAGETVRKLFLQIETILFEFVNILQDISGIIHVGRSTGNRTLARILPWDTLRVRIVINSYYYRIVSKNWSEKIIPSVSLTPSWMDSILRSLDLPKTSRLRPEDQLTTQGIC